MEIFVENIEDLNNHTIIVLNPILIEMNLLNFSEVAKIPKTAFNSLNLSIWSADDWIFVYVNPCPQHKGLMVIHHESVDFGEIPMANDDAVISHDTLMEMRRQQLLCRVGFSTPCKIQFKLAPLEFLLHDN